MKKMLPYAIYTGIALMIVGAIIAALFDDASNKKIVYFAISISGIFICFDFLKTSGREDFYLKVGAIILPILTLIVIGFLGKSDELYKKEELEEKIRKINLKIGELKMLKHKGIIEEVDFDNKVSKLKNEEKYLKIEFQLKKNNKYAAINDALKKGYINKAQFEEKLALIKVEIENNLK